MNQKHLKLFLILPLISLGGCFSKLDGQQKAVVVTVNSDELRLITFSESLARRLKDLNALSAKDPGIVKKAKEAIIQEFIISSLIRGFAEKNNVKTTEAELEKKIAEIRSIYPDDLSFRRLLADEAISFNDWKQLTQRELLREKVFAELKKGMPQITEEEIKTYYEVNKQKFKNPEQIFVKQIVVDEQTKAEELKLALKNRKFEDLAKKYSASPEGKNGGDVGWISKGELAVFDIVFNQKIGTVSNVLESDYGFHIIQITNRRSAGFIPLNEVRNQILNTLSAQREQSFFAKWLDDEIRNSKIKKDLALIEQVSVATEGNQ